MSDPRTSGLSGPATLPSHCPRAWLCRPPRFTVELANLRAAFRWAANQGDLDAAAGIVTYAALLGFAIENYEPTTWAEELIDPARAINHPRLAFLYVIASQCWVAGPIEAAVRYSQAGQAVISSGCDDLPFGAEGLLGIAYLTAGQPERAVDWCRAQLTRGHDTHTLTWAYLVAALGPDTGRHGRLPDAALAQHADLVLAAQQRANAGLDHLCRTTPRRPGGGRVCCTNR